MMGGGGGFFPPPKQETLEMLENAKKAAQEKRTIAELNRYLQGLLAGVNERDTDTINALLDDIQDIVGDEVSVDQLVFGGSVAKHTYVDGLSDVDALAVLDRADLEGKSPAEVLDIFYKNLRDKLTYDKVESVERGKLAVTIKYRDGNEIQILPAIKSGDGIAISDTSGNGWNHTNPEEFRNALTDANKNLNGALVRAIKLAKSAIANLPEQKRLSGYHVEALAVESAKSYAGEKTVGSVLINFFKDASARVLNPLTDKTGQSRTVDAYLGAANSTKRRIVADGLQTIARKLQSGNLQVWSEIIEGQQ